MILIDVVFLYNNKLTFWCINNNIFTQCTLHTQNAEMLPLPSECSMGLSVCLSGPPLGRGNFGGCLRVCKQQTLAAAWGCRLYSMDSRSWWKRVFGMYSPPHEGDVWGWCCLSSKFFDHLLSLALVTAEDCDVVQEIADVEKKLSDLQREQMQTKELELKAARDRHVAIEDLEKAVSWCS